MPKIYISEFATGQDVDDALEKALTAVQEAPKDGHQWARKDGAWVLAGVGEPGLDAYELAVKNGYTGSLQEWLDGQQGKSAYEVAVKNGFVGSEREWLESLHGRDGFSAATAKTLYYVIADDNQNRVTLSTPDILGNTMELNPLTDTVANLTVTYNGVVLRPAGTADPSADWSLDALNNQVVFTQPLSKDRVVTVTRLEAQETGIGLRTARLIQVMDARAFGVYPTEGLSDGQLLIQQDTGKVYMWTVDHWHELGGSPGGSPGGSKVLLQEHNPVGETLLDLAELLQAWKQLKIVVTGQDTGLLLSRTSSAFEGATNLVFRGAAVGNANGVTEVSEFFWQGSQEAKRLISSTANMYVLEITLFSLDNNRHPFQLSVIDNQNVLNVTGTVQLGALIDGLRLSWDSAGERTIQVTGTA